LIQFTGLGFTIVSSRSAHYRGGAQCPVPRGLLGRRLDPIHLGYTEWLGGHDGQPFTRCDCLPVQTSTLSMTYIVGTYGLGSLFQDWELKIVPKPQAVGMKCFG
jgi:hypothetical protein